MWTLLGLDFPNFGAKLSVSRCEPALDSDQCEIGVVGAKALVSEFSVVLERQMSQIIGALVSLFGTLESNI